MVVMSGECTIHHREEGGHIMRGVGYVNAGTSTDMFLP